MEGHLDSLVAMPQMINNILHAINYITEISEKKVFASQYKRPQHLHVVDEVDVSRSSDEVIKISE